MDIQEIQALLEKYANGQCTPEELTVIEEWYRSFDEGKGSPFRDEAHRQQVRKEIMDRVHAAVVNDTTGMTVPLAVKRIKIIRFPIFYKVAAAVMAGLLVAGAGFLIHRHNGREVEYITASAAAGKIQKLILPDSSTVWLNAASIIKYPKKFGSHTRDVYIEDGEAFFEARSDRRRPFIVHAGGLLTRVLGTSFDIKSYKQLADVRVTVVSGAVQVADSVLTFGVYTRNQQLDYNRQTGQYAEATVNANEAMEWRSGMVVLNRASFAEVALTLQNLYNMPFDYSGFHADNYQYTISFSSNLKLQEVLDILKGIHDMNYKIENNKVIISAIR